MSEGFDGADVSRAIFGGDFDFASETVVGAAVLDFDLASGQVVGAAV